MNITKEDLKELYVKRQDVLLFEKYVNRIKEAYNTLEELNQPEFEEQKVRTLIYHIMCPDDQVKACVHTAREYFKADFAGACTYIASEISRIFPEKDPVSQRYRNSGRDTSNKRCNKRHVASAASRCCQHKKDRKENGVYISNISRYSYPDQ